MNINKIILILLLFVLKQPLFSQDKLMDTIFVNIYKSSQLVFSEDTTFDFIDVGTGDLHVTYREIKNVCIIQSMVSGDKFKDTNLFIKTKDNGVYNFIISYDDTPNEYTYYIDQSINTNISAISTTLNTEGKNFKNTNILIENIIKDKQKAFKPATEYHTDTKCEFYGSYFFDKKLYYKIKISNESFLDYTIKDYYIYAKNKKSRNTADSERFLKPIKIFANSETIKGKSEEYIVIEFEQFSLNKKEELFIEIKEGSNGQRDFKLTLPHYITNSPIIL